MADSNQNKQKFTEHIDGLINEELPFKMTFSRPRHQNKDVNNIYLRPVTLKNKIQYALTFRYKNKDEVKNYTKEQMYGTIDHLLGNMFYNAVLFTDEEEITFLQSKKGKSNLHTRPIDTPVKVETTHDHQKTRPIPAATSWLQALGLSGKDGKIHDKSQDKFRQINKYIEIIGHLIKDLPEDSVINIADMGSGKGYLTFALYDYLVNTKKMRVKMTGYEMREDIVTLCYQTAISEGYVGLTFQQKNIEDVDTTNIDMVIALHACDIATDLAIAKGIQSDAKYIIVSPCCHQQVRKSMKHNNELSPILAHGILEERQAEILTDGIRALLMEAHGYKTQVFEFISSEHTSKNLMITGVKSSPDVTALAKVEKIKSHFGIEYHHLQRLLEEQG
ncbi:MAG: SAM-dependent methyltransferase [Saprospiraceae bacterium]